MAGGGDREQANNTNAHNMERFFRRQYITLEMRVRFSVVLHTRKKYKTCYTVSIMASQKKREKRHLGVW